MRLLQKKYFLLINGMEGKGMEFVFQNCTYFYSAIELQFFFLD